MRYYLLLLTLLIHSTIMAQSPFNYGQNKQVYFISKEERHKMGLDTIYTFKLRKRAKEARWITEVTIFDSASVSDDFTLTSKDSTFKFNFDTLSSNFDGAHFLYGRLYEFSNEMLTGYGTIGPGYNDWKIIKHLSDTASSVETCKSGLPSELKIWSTNVFDENGRIICTRIDSSNKNYLEDSIKELIDSSIVKAGTFFYNYNGKGLLLNYKTEEDTVYITDVKEIKKLFIDKYLGYPLSSGHKFSCYKYHQCYVRNIKMEKYFKKKIGYLPELVLIELYQYGVFSFVFDKTDKKYYRTRDVLLEQ